MAATFLPAAQHRAQPWKNGLGVSHTIADFPRGAEFDTVQWQAGSTEIGADCPFSDLPGLDRQFTVTSGAGVELTCIDEAGARTVNRVDRLHAPFAFRGDWRTSCRLLDGRVQVFNVMTRRGRFSAAVEFVNANPGYLLKKSAGERLLAVELASMNAWLLGAPVDESCKIAAAGKLALVRISADSR